MIAREPITVRDWLLVSSLLLTRAGVNNAAGDTEAILCKALGTNRSHLLLDQSRILSPPETVEGNRLLARRLEGEPLHYIIEETEFYGIRLKTDPRALIPRPETEVLVEWALEIVEAKDYGRVLDIGTGTGAIAMAISANSDCEVTALEKSAEAMELASENIELNGMRDGIRLISADVMNGSFAENTGGDYDLVLSNPPYVSRREMGGLPREVKEYEPARALDGGEDGLDFYRRLAEVLHLVCREGGWALLEIAEMRAVETAEILSPVLKDIEIRDDLSGRPRVLGGRCFSV